MFEITANNLMREADMKSLKLQNENYAITFFYYGDYAEDMKKNGRCDVKTLSMSCKMNGDALPIAYMAGKILIDVQAPAMLFVDDVATFKAQLDSAYIAAVELQNILKQYFGFTKTGI